MTRVLVVDDDVELANVIQDWLSLEDLTVEMAHKGADAWSKLSAGDFDVVLLDWDLPDINGIDVLRRFRASGGRTPVIFLTGHDSVDDKEKGLDSGANDYLTKPFHMKELTARIRALLRDRSAPPPKLEALGSGNEQVLERADLKGTALAASYEFMEVLGEGGVAIVFKARHPRLDKLVAVKMLQKAEIREETLARFEREAKTISQLDHPNIIILYDFGVTEKWFPYMVMEFIAGRSLESMIASDDFVPLQRALEILVPAADGLAHAHAGGVLHRDVKPGNVMVRELPDGSVRAKLLDFGLAALRPGQETKGMRLTQTQQIIGTPPYMSPEQVLGKDLDERSDVYSFGCLLFETLSGYVPFCGDTATEVMYKHIDEAPLTFAEVRPEAQFPPELQHIVSRCLEKTPDRRFQSMRELKDALERVQLFVKARELGMG